MTTVVDISTPNLLADFLAITGTPRQHEIMDDFMCSPRVWDVRAKDTDRNENGDAASFDFALVFCAFWYCLSNKDSKTVIVCRNEAQRTVLEGMMTTITNRKHQLAALCEWTTHRMTVKGRPGYYIKFVLPTSAAAKPNSDDFPPEYPSRFMYVNLNANEGCEASFCIESVTERSYVRAINVW